MAKPKQNHRAVYVERVRKAMALDNMTMSKAEYVEALKSYIRV